MANTAAVRHFERAAAGYTDRRARWPLGVLRGQEQRALRSLVRIDAGAWVLDAGCGDGETLAWLAECGAHGVGVDLAWPMTLRCRGRGFLVCVQDIETIAFAPRFDWVLCVGSLEFVTEPARALAAMAACLRPGGRLALLFPRRGCIGALYAAYHRTHAVRARLFSAREVVTMCAAAGLEPEAWQHGTLSSLCVARGR